MTSHLAIIFSESLQLHLKPSNQRIEYWMVQTDRETETRLAYNSLVDKEELEVTFALTLFRNRSHNLPSHFIYFIYGW